MKRSRAARLAPCALLVLVVPPLAACGAKETRGGTPGEPTAAPPPEASAPVASASITPPVVSASAAASASARPPPPAPPGPAVFDVRWSEPGVDGRLTCLRPGDSAFHGSDKGPPPLPSFVAVSYEVVAGAAPIELDAALTPAPVNGHPGAQHFALAAGERRRGLLRVARSTLLKSICEPKATPIDFTVRSGTQVLGRSTLTRANVRTVALAPAPFPSRGFDGRGFDTGEPLVCAALPAATSLKMVLVTDDEGPFRLVHEATREAVDATFANAQAHMMGMRGDHEATFPRAPIAADACRVFPTFGIAFQHTKKPATSGRIVVRYAPGEIDTKMVNVPAEMLGTSEKP